MNEWNTSGVPFRERLRRQFAVLVGSLKRLLATSERPSQGYASQRMCPFCGLITPRSKPSCVECGKSFRGDQLKPHNATQK
jgi:hypothetical protein